MLEYLRDLLNPKTIIHVGGLGLLMVVVFAETGLLIGIIFPGDSLLFTAGLLTSVGVIQTPFPIVAFLIALAAFLGDQSGYWIGWRTGRALYNRPKSFFFRPEYIQTTKDFYHKHGIWVLVLGKFLPIIRTFAPVLAGVINMPYLRFALVSLIGSAAWPAILVSAGYFLGGIRWVQDYYEWIIVAMVLLTTGPVILRILRARRKRVSIQG
ncbi:MAG: VTT domain-containing protein [Bacteroidia bacterium]|nr:VTT domain-containing protein [Bacteroidia bacterium]